MTLQASFQAPATDTDPPSHTTRIAKARKHAPAVSANMDRRVASLLGKALADAWNPEADLPWDSRVELEEVDLSDRHSLIAKLPEFSRFGAREHSGLKVGELGWCLSNLLEGEWRGGLLAAQMMLDCAPESRQTAAFISTVMHDEVKHHEVLRRYLEAREGLLMKPHGSFDQLFTDLQHHPVWELKVLVGQLVFEATATSTLHSLFMHSREPLLTAILRRIMKDEARHLAFTNCVIGEIPQRYSAETVHEVEDVMFEAVVACVSTFAPEPVWQRMGLPMQACRRAAFEALCDTGIIDFYSRVLPRQLAQRGFPSDRLSRLLGDGLKARLCDGLTLA